MSEKKGIWDKHRLTRDVPESGYTYVMRLKNLFESRGWHRFWGCRYKTDQLSEICDGCGTPQGDWWYFGGPSR